MIYDILCILKIVFLIAWYMYMDSNKYYYWWVATYISELWSCVFFIQTVTKDEQIQNGFFDLVNLYS